MPRAQKALVVDDLAVNRLILGTILHKLGFEVLEAENGLQCIDVYNQERTQLVCVFLDLQMPVADGWAATKGIRELESQEHNGQHLRVPVVVCTASCLDDLVDNGQTVAQRALSLGADGAVHKPRTVIAVQRILDEYAPSWRASLKASNEPTALAATTTCTAPDGPVSPSLHTLAQDPPPTARPNPPILTTITINTNNNTAWATTTINTTTINDRIAHFPRPGAVNDQTQIASNHHHHL